MNNLPNQSSASPETIRKLVVPAEPQAEAKGGDLPTTKAERDAPLKVLAETDATASDEPEIVRKLVVPGMQAVDKDDNRSPTKTERTVDLAAIAQANQELS
jgi:hypothetical protein